MKFFLLSLSFFLFVGNSFSQTFEGGFFGGLTASQVDGDSYAGFNKIGLTAGGYITKEINRKANWKAELRYIQKGSYSKPSEDNFNLYKLTIHYVEIPLMLQYKIYQKVIVDAGISPDIYLFHKETDQDGEMDQTYRPDYHRFGLNGNIGVYYMLTDNILAGARSSYSLIPMRDHASSQTYLLNRGQYNAVISFTLYYHFK
ncbi:MAG: PorT family protein [Bacteroidales bacterium]|nr:PorT family protein [Bacteroidales bacterium]MCF8389624.1 PorT family protein [Bacteroidales bacterium]